MQKTLITLILFVICQALYAQNILTASKTHIKFFSHTPVKDIDAETTAASTLINLQTKDVAVRIPIKSFIFPNKLMQEHFNENYMDSEKIPNASFKGKIVENLDLSKDGKLPVTTIGKINIHGIEREQTLKGTATIANRSLTIDLAFDVSLTDHNIEVPKVVFVEIAEKIRVTCKFSYIEKK
jgi:polyisoprenoid-binding protein YceI